MVSWSAYGSMMNTRSQWLNDAYDLGLWDVNMSGANMADLIESGVFGEAADLNLGGWESVGGYWNGDVDGAAAFYERLWDHDDDTYTGRDAICFGDGFDEMTGSTFNDEFGDFEEYCDDTCGCDTATTSTPTSTTLESSTPTSNSSESRLSELSGGTIACIVIAVVVALVVILVVIFVSCRQKESEAEDTDIDDGDQASERELESLNA